MKEFTYKPKYKYFRTEYNDKNEVISIVELDNDYTSCKCNKTDSINHSNEIDSEIEKYGCDGKENNSKDKLYYNCLRKDGLID